MKYEQILAILDEWIATYEQGFDYLWVQGRMKVLDKSIKDRREKLDKTFIKIPFTGKRLFDDIGMLPGHKWITTALMEDAKEVTKYNRLLEQAKRMVTDLIETQSALIPEVGRLAREIDDLPESEIDHRLTDRTSRIASYMSSAQAQRRAIDNITNEPKKRITCWKVGAKR
ncbi:hypothetical protein [Limosilactobacillus fermentum]|uniref:hypothetical protein n=1 Tax=Limosilactobacillus fermentum TaxID=1613 RepID=UPI0023E44E95|nr:hypothetical protein [Limosilactobacillus fermentum]MDF4006812.1 hypothetical protein [Limosilactobacillus fermentum]MDF4015766.1 hypothetical protein [Limosilactobacillus fermentum]